LTRPGEGACPGKLATRRCLWVVAVPARRGAAMIIGRCADVGRIVLALIRRGETVWVAECPEVAVVTQGATLDETVTSLREAVALHLEDEDLEKLEGGGRC